MTDAPLIVFGGICLIAFGVVAFMVFRAVFQEIGSMRGDIKGIMQALAQIAEFQGNLIDEMPEKHGERLVKVEKWIEGREALARHITAQAQHRRGGEGSMR